MSLDFDGVDLSDEQKEALNSQFDNAVKSKTDDLQSQINKLAENNSKLLDEKNEARAQKTKALEAEESAKREAAIKNSDVESLNNSWQQKYDDLLNENQNIKAGIKKSEIDKIAQGFVNENVVNDAFSREAMTNEISKRLDLRDGNPVVLDAGGNLTALSVDDLFNEFKTASKYKSHIVANKASGGGAEGGGHKNNGSVVDLSKMNKTELSIYARQNPEEYQAWVSKQH